MNKRYVAAVIFDTHDRILLCKRALYKKIAPGMWHLPGGAVEGGETDEEALDRELKEELGLVSTRIISTGIEIEKTRTQIFVVQIGSQVPVVQNHENSDLQFVPIAHIAQYLEPDLVSDYENSAVKSLQVLKTLNRD